MKRIENKVYLFLIKLGTKTCTSKTSVLPSRYHTPQTQNYNCAYFI